MFEYTVKICLCLILSAFPNVYFPCVHDTFPSRHGSLRFTCLLAPFCTPHLCPGAQKQKWGGGKQAGKRCCRPWNSVLFFKMSVQCMFICFVLNRVQWTLYLVVYLQLEILTGSYKTWILIDFGQLSSET